LSSSSPGPVQPGERIELLDVLRGFALFGVLTANLLWAATSFAVTPQQMQALPTRAADTLATYLVCFFVDWKFYTLFSFLFGLGFYVQLSRAEAKGADGPRWYRRRLLVLYGIGVLHLLFVWYGDILNVYALLGVLLLACRRLSTRTLLVASALLILSSQTVVKTWPVVKDAVRGPARQPAAAASHQPHPEQPPTDAHKKEAERFRVFTSGRYADVVALHAREYVPGFWGSGIGVMFALAIFGKFLLGFLAGRHRLLEAPEEHAAFFRRLLVWGLPVGLVGNAVFMWHLWVERSEALPESSWPVLATLGIADVGLVALAGVYVAGIALLFRRPAWRRWLGLLAPVGRMALTNYLTHSLIYVALFYGYGPGPGLLGRVGATFCLLVAVLVFAAQIAFSRLWLSRFRFGPMEWLWRSLTYGVAQPMVLPAAASR
jgi:uncharacterized protein